MTVGRVSEFKFGGAVKAKGKGYAEGGKAEPTWEESMSRVDRARKRLDNSTDVMHREMTERKASGLRMMDEAPEMYKRGGKVKKGKR